MQRRSFLKKAAAGAAAGSIAAPAIAQSQPSIQWRMAASWPKSLDTIYGAAELVARRVGEITDGKFQIRVFAAGEIVPALQVLDAVQAGTVEMGHTATYYYFGKDPTFALGTSVGFGGTCARTTRGGSSAAVPRRWRRCSRTTAASRWRRAAPAARWAERFRKEVKTVADLKGLKFRIGGMAGMVLAKLGVVPQMIGGPDIYPALEKGTIDGAEWVGPYDDEKLGFNKVAKYYYYPGWWEGGPISMMLINEKQWQGLPKAYQAALHAACSEACVWMPAKYDSQNPDALRRLVASGTKLSPYSREIMEASEKAAYELYDELMSKSEHWKRVYPAWKKFRDDQFLWFRVAESTYDNYVFNSKIGRPK